MRPGLKICFLSDYSIPDVGEERDPPARAPPKRRRKTEVEEAWRPKSSQQKGKSQRKRNVGNLAYARQQRLRAVIGFNVSHLPCDDVSSERQMIAAEIATGKGARHLHGGVKPWNL